MTLLLRSLPAVVAILLLASCSERADAPPAPAAPTSAAAPQATPVARPGGDVMDGGDKTAGALVGTGETYGGPSHFGAAGADSEALRVADAPSGLIDPLRGASGLMEQNRPLPIANAENRDIRRNRSFVLQPPTIPHKIDGYQIDRNANRCMTCHARTRIEESKAVPVSITHYTDRAGNMLADISPRRYFCDQCHVVQTETNLLIANRYEDVEEIVRREATAATRKGGAGKGTPAPPSR